jgi:gliding motility-associated-like protein
VQSCTASACPPVDITLDAPALDFCLGDNPEAVAISTAFDGSDGSGTISWSGPGVDVNGFFNPINAGAGTHVVTMAYAEGNCDDYGSTITFNVYESPDAGVQFSQPDCYLNDSTLVDFVVTGGDGNYTYILEGDTLTASDALLTPGGYTLMVVDGNLCSAMSNFTINNPVQPFPVIEGDTLLTEGDFGIYSINPGIFAGLAIDSIVWFANGVEICNESDCFEISDAPPAGGTAYQVTVFYNDGCEVSAFYNVTVEEEEPVTVVTIPNIFSPNGDGANDDFYIYTNDPEVVINSFRIYDRWGNQVFNNETPYTPFDTQITWDGTMNGSVVQPGVYVYVLELVEDGRTKVRSGDITILR